MSHLQTPHYGYHSFRDVTISDTSLPATFFNAITNQWSIKTSVFLVLESDVITNVITVIRSQMYHSFHSKFINTATVARIYYQ